jgi:hypothetical protein
MRIRPLHQLCGLSAALPALSYAAWILILSAGCSGIGKARAVALYPNPEQARAPESVARLEGPIRSIDGVDVEMKGTTFELLPGCHVVTMTPTIGDGNVSGAWSADFGRVVYAFRMKPGKTYSIDPEPRFGSAGHGSVRLRSYERNADGTISGALSPAASDEDIDACEVWGEKQGFAGSAVCPAPGGVQGAPSASAGASFPE